MIDLGTGNNNKMYVMLKHHIQRRILISRTSLLPVTGQSAINKR